MATEISKRTTKDEIERMLLVKTALPQKVRGSPIAWSSLIVAWGIQRCNLSPEDVVELPDSVEFFRRLTQYDGLLESAQALSPQALLMMVARLQVGRFLAEDPKYAQTNSEHEKRKRCDTAQVIGLY